MRQMNWILSQIKDLQPTLHCDILVSIIIFDTKQRGDGNAKNKAADD